MKLGLLCFEKNVDWGCLRKSLSGPNYDETVRRLTIFRNEELPNLYYLPDILRRNA
jgi:hypothetical protein